MDVSPYLMRRLRSLEEFLETKGTSATVWRQEVERTCERPAASPRATGAGGAKADRARLVLVCSNDQAMPADHGGGA